MGIRHLILLTMVSLIQSGPTQGYVLHYQIRQTAVAEGAWKERGSSLSALQFWQLWHLPRLLLT